MAKFEIKVKVNDEENIYNCIYDESLRKIKYIENDELNTMMVVDLANKTIHRENKDINMLLTFDTNTYKITNCKLKDLQKEILFDTNTIKLEVLNTKFHVIYELIQNEEIVNVVDYEITTDEGEFL